MAWPKSRPVTPGSDASPRLTVKPRPPRPAVAGTLPEGRRPSFDAGTGSGPEGSSLTANARRLEGFGVEENEGFTCAGPGAAGGGVPARQGFHPWDPTGGLQPPGGGLCPLPLSPRRGPFGPGLRPWNPGVGFRPHGGGLRPPHFSPRRGPFGPRTPRNLWMSGGQDRVWPERSTEESLEAA